MFEGREPYLKLQWADTESSAHGFLVIDRLVGGIATGGLRMRAGCTAEEVLDLAREMTHKTGLYNLPVGGAKGGIDYPSDAPDADEVRLRFVQAMRPMLENFWTAAGDLGTPQDRLDAVFARAGLGGSSMLAALRRSVEPEKVAGWISHGFTDRIDGFSMPEMVGGYGVAQAALASLEHDGTDPRDARLVVQGVGAMGGSTALYLARAGVKVVGMADVWGVIYNPDGLDVAALLDSRGPGAVIDRAAMATGDMELACVQWLDIDCEILVPAATSYVINADNCDSVRARFVVEAANVSTSASAEARLLQRGTVVVPDFVANAGAVAWAWWVAFGQVDTPRDSQARLGAELAPLVRQLLAEMDRSWLSPRRIALKLADERSDQMLARYGGVNPVMGLHQAAADAYARLYPPEPVVEQPPALAG